MSQANGSDSPPSEWIHLKVPAKLNLYLQVGSLRSDGYHDIATVYQAIDLYDELKVIKKPSQSGMSITASGKYSEGVPLDSGNLVLKAAQHLASHTGVASRAQFELVKSIPSEAGLGGGSADAAAALLACNLLWKTGLSDRKLMELGAQIGEDIPFFLTGMMAIGMGHREPLIPISAGKYSWHWVLAIPTSGLLTKDVFRKFDALTTVEIDESQYLERADRCQNAAWGTTPPDQLVGLLGNDLEEAAKELLPEIKIALNSASNLGALSCLMSGSGSTCAFLAKDDRHALNIKSSLRELKIFRSVITTRGPVSGIEILAASMS